MSLSIDRLCLGVLSLLLVDGSALAQGAPKELLGKSVLVQGTATVVWIDSDGNHTATAKQDRTIYVSMTGRVFSRVKNGKFNEDQVPGEKTQERSYRVQGNSLVSRTTVNGIYQDIVISFDRSFSTCFYAATRKIVGPSKTLEGKQIQITSLTGDPTCVVKDGNPFAE